ncbi:MAG: hypothetical protein QOG00_1126 [Pyrinomonadaceae bacterium]|nr:hypothetical protein [Pyrinomonadaceae bacterium]
MRSSRPKKFALAALALTLGCAIWLTPAPQTDAADHFDAPLVASDQGADLADAYFFLDPNNNANVVVAMTVQGFIVPGEAQNAGGFDHNVRYRFELENTGDAKPDRFIDVTFSQRTASNSPQTATVTLPNGTTFNAPTTAPSATSDTSPAPTITDSSGVKFFAGVVDDPFFFDIPGFNRFVGSVLAGAPDATPLQRGRDTFAGYNIKAIALLIPAAQLRGTAGNVVGLSAVTQRRSPRIITKQGEVSGVGRYANVDRIATPAVNVALIPFARKNEYNAATTIDDANLRFAGSIIGTLQALGTSQENINLLAGVAVLKGDFLRLDTSKENTGAGSGVNAGSGFPNGRRLSDDVIDTILAIVTNGAITTGDNVNSNDVAFRNEFPFFAPSIQPFPKTTIDDRTRN